MKTMIARITNFQCTHSEMYKIIKSLCCVQKPTHSSLSIVPQKQRHQICGHQRWECDKGDLDKGSQRHKPPVMST